MEEEEHESKEQRYHRVQWTRVFQISEELKISPIIINKAISELSLLDQKERPQYIMLLAGNKVFLVEVEKWFRGSYLQYDIEELFTEATIERKYYSLFYLMLSKEMLAPDSEMVLMDQLEEDSHKSAYEVTKDLKEGIIHAVEALANESLYYKKVILKEEFDESDGTFEQEVKDDCLSIVYRLLFVFYAESRADLDILPISDRVYQKGYSLEMLRDLEQMQLITDHSRNGYFFHKSLKQLFHLMSSGYRENENQTIKLKNGEVVSTLKNKSFRIRHIDSPMFDDNKLHQLKEVKFRNYVWQDVICQLSLSRMQNNKARGRISYANLGINQLGSVYESLLAYRGFYAEEDYIEVHPKKKPKKGTLLVQRKRRDDFHEDEVLKNESGKEIIIPKGQFVYRLSGRDRQKSASYYTPEVLTQCTVKYTLKSILEKVENGEMKALDLLDLKLLEPAMGAAAFHNELINQLAESYLNYRQKEKKQKISPEKYREELQKVKAYIATNNAYGVDLNPTAIELGKLSLWLNVIHKDMETPFFANRLAVGNAVVGAWFKVYTQSQLKKKWWEKAPKLLQLGPGGKKRAKNEIYHFLLLDKGMVPSAGIKLLKDEFPTHAAIVSSWRREAIKPITGIELRQLQKICDSIDEQLHEYYTFQKRLNAQTKNKLDIWGGFQDKEQIGLNLRSYDEKEQLYDQRSRQSAPYYKLKMVMDYWCSFWFWDVRKAEYLPSRQQYINDITSILKIDLTKKSKAEKVASLSFKETQPSLFEDPSVGEQAQQQIIDKTQKGDLFDNKERLEEVKYLTSQYRFFHNQLEFIEVFKGRGGFDVITGNPPWVKVLFREKDLLSDFLPEIEIRDVKAPIVKKNVLESLGNEAFLQAYYNEFVEIESLGSFLNSRQCYPLLIGQQTDLYKCVIENGFELINSNGYMGLIHPEGIYDEPKGELLRNHVYHRLSKHFQFVNSMNLFPEIPHKQKYGINVYGGLKNKVNFDLINNLYHPSTVYGCYSHDGKGEVGGLKVIDSKTKKQKWNINPHYNRIIKVDRSVLDLINTTFEEEYSEAPKLVSIHSRQIISVINSLSKFEGKLTDVENINSEGLHETSAQNENIIIKKTKFPEMTKGELIFSGPHFYVSNPLSKCPRENPTGKADFDTIELNSIKEDFLPRTNYIPTNEKIGDYNEKFKNNSSTYKYYKLGFSKMLNVTMERTLQPAILPPNTSHINGVMSSSIKDVGSLIEFAGITSSLLLDFYIRTVGRSNLYDITLKSLPLGIDIKYLKEINPRTLLLNCLNEYYSSLWENNWKDEYKKASWASNDSRLKMFSTLSKRWNWETPLRNWFERRQALVEIDVITSMALDLTLDELILIYNVQFPVLQQNEVDTWYDTKGNIVFTCSKGLIGVGVDRPVWNTIKEFKLGGTYEHTIKKSELYYGKKVTYYAPFDKCDRVEDYKTAWAHFEQIFKEN
ncbi:MAG: hypothetical protein HOD63_09370 [Bacteroidetes bacterium]|nr:hypothetical protein [Bacteroidota bacterium]